MLHAEITCAHTHACARTLLHADTSTARTYVLHSIIWQTYNLKRQIHDYRIWNALNSNVTTRLRLRRFAEVRSFACKIKFRRMNDANLTSGNNVNFVQERVCMQTGSETGFRFRRNPFHSFCRLHANRFGHRFQFGSNAVCTFRSKRSMQTFTQNEPKRVPCSQSKLI